MSNAKLHSNQLIFFFNKCFLKNDQFMKHYTTTSYSDRHCVLILSFKYIVAYLQATNSNIKALVTNIVRVDGCQLNCIYVTDVTSVTNQAMQQSCYLIIIMHWLGLTKIHKKKKKMNSWSWFASKNNSFFFFKYPSKNNIVWKFEYITTRRQVRDNGANLNAWYHLTSTNNDHVITGLIDRNKI